MMNDNQQTAHTSSQSTRGKQANTPSETLPWVADLGDGTYQNPVLFADYSDPDVIRVDDDFYMVASSFNCMPGIPVLHSTDLIQWQIINHVFQRFPYEAYDRPMHGCGAWAPSIRYHDGYYWVFFGAPDEGIFMSRTTDPFGEWSPLVCVHEAKGWIDPCPFWDDDGQAYLVHAFAKSRAGIKSVLQICAMRSDGTGLLDERNIVFDGTDDHPTLEGPKMYKRNGYYYIFAPGGGVKQGWQTVLRARHIFGPYEDKIVLHQGHTPINGPHQGGYIELENGDGWFMHFQDRGAYGRIVHLQPVEWENDWPMIGDVRERGAIGEPILRGPKPTIQSGSKSRSSESGSTASSSPSPAPINRAVRVPQMSDDFEADTLGLQWQWEANPRPEWYSLTERAGWLRLYSQPLPSDASSLRHAPNVLLQKFPAPAFRVQTELEVNTASVRARSGLVVMGRSFAYVAIDTNEHGNRLVFVQGDGDGERIVAERAIAHPRVTLAVHVQENARCQMYCRTNNASLEPIGPVFDAVPGHWMGAKVGLFSTIYEASEQRHGEQSWVDVESFRISK